MLYCSNFYCSNFMISYKNAIRLLIVLLSIVIVFHLLILVKIIPFDIAWGGRLKSEQEMYIFESISITLNVFLIWILSMKMKNRRKKLVNFILMVFFIIFSLNTIGNLLAHTTIEKYFSILTFIFAILIFRILYKTE